MIEGDKGQTQNLKYRGVFCNDQSDCSHSKDHRECSKPHFKDIFQTFLEKFFDTGCFVCFIEGQLHAVLSGGHVVGNILTVRNSAVIGFGYFGKRRKFGNDDSRNNTGQSYNEIEGKKQMLQADLTDDDKAECNTDSREGGSDDNSFALGVKTFFILFLKRGIS